MKLSEASGLSFAGVKVFCLQKLLLLACVFARTYFLAFYWVFLVSIELIACLIAEVWFIGTKTDAAGGRLLGIETGLKKMSLKALIALLLIVNLLMLFL